MAKKTKDTNKSKGEADATTTPQAKTTRHNSKDNSLHNQRQKLMNWFFEHGSITTPEAREELDIMHPAGRIRELKARGHDIGTVWDSWTSEHGIKHRIGRYVLVKKNQ